jgi:hypothetical protein
LIVRPLLGRGQYAGLALLFLGFAVYGSLVPFHLRRLPFDEAVRLYSRGTGPTSRRPISKRLDCQYPAFSALGLFVDGGRML